MNVENRAKSGQIPAVKSREAFFSTTIFLLLAFGAGSAHAQNKDQFITVGRERVHATRILARYRAGVPALQQQAVLLQQGVTIRRQFSTIPGLVVFDVKKGPVLAAVNGAGQKPPLTELAERMAALKATGLFAYVEPDYEVHATAMPTDSAFVDGTLWGLRNVGQNGGAAGADIGATAAWDITTGSTNVIVAIIDTGIRYTHNDLAAQMWRNPGEIPGNGIDDDGDGFVDDVFGINAILNNGDPMDDNDHGTHVAGTIGAAANDGHPHVGVAWNVRLMACKFLDSNGSGAISDAIECINFAVQHGARILNNSWGGGGFSQGLLDAITAARNQGVLFVAAAGNSAGNNDFSASYPASYDVDNIIAVAAIDRSDNLANFSNFGSNTVHLGAPGVAIYSSTKGSDSEYQIFSGTSMATPHVVGVAALIRAYYPNIGLVELRQRLLLGTIPISSLQGKTVSGGRLNAYYSLVATPDGLLELSLKAQSGQALSAGSVTPLYVQVTDLAPVLGATVTATVAGLTNLTFLDNGLPPDVTAGDGVYSANLIVPTGTNSLTVTVDVSAAGKNPGLIGRTFPILIPPTNDNFASRVTISSTPATVTGNNRNATAEPGEHPHAGRAATKSVWWTWTAPTNGVATITTLGSDFDTILAVYTGNAVNALTEKASNDDFSIFFSSQVTFAVTSGTAYQIAVDGFFGSEGNISMNISMSGGVTNDNFAARIPIQGINVTAYGSNLGASSEPGEPLHAGVFGGQSIWWTWTAPSNALVLVSTAGSTFSSIDYPLNTLLAVYQGNSVSNLVPIASNNDAMASQPTSRLAFLALAGQVYQIAVDSYPGGAGNIILNLATLPPNDNFDDRIALTGRFIETIGYNILATKEPGEPQHAGDPGGQSLWWTWTAPDSGNATVTTSGSTFDTTLGVYTGTAVNNLSLIVSNDDVSLGVIRYSQVNFPVTAGTTYQIAVDGFYSQVWDDTGRIDLNLTLNGSSRLGLGGLQTNGGFQFTVSGEPDRLYVIQSSTNLIDWLPISTNRLSGKTFTFTDPTVTNSVKQYYRAYPPPLTQP